MNFNFGEFHYCRALSCPEKMTKLKIYGDIAPLTVYIELTNKCNFACPWCTIPKGNDVLPLDLLGELSYNLNSCGVNEIIFTGGESLLHPQFIDVIELFKGFKIGLETNGELIGNKTELLAKTCSWIKIPMEHANIEDLAAARGCLPSRFPNIAFNIKQLRDAIRNHKTKCKIIIEVKYYKDNVKELKNIAEQWFPLGKNACLYVKPLQTKHNDRALNKQALLFALNSTNYYNGFKTFVDVPVSNPTQLKCSVHYYATYISATGEIYPCEELSNNIENSYGSLRTFSFSDIWDGMLRTNIIQNLKCSQPCQQYNKNVLMNNELEK